MSERKIRIGLIIDYLTSEYSESLIKSIQEYCKQADIDLLFFVIGELHNVHASYGYQNLAITSLIRTNNLDGIIMTSGTQMHGISQSYYIQYLKSYSPLPIMNISMQMPGYPSILVDCNKAYDEMIQHLIDTQKCTKFGIIEVNTNSVELKSRKKIIYDVLERNGITKENIVVWKSDLQYDVTYSVLLNYLKENNYSFDVDTIIALNDDVAYACIDFVHNHTNKKVPKDIIVTGFDDLQRASFSDPSLTSINQQVEYQGKKAAETLHKIILGKKVELIQTIEAKANIRESSQRVKLSKRNFKNTKFISLDNITPEVLHDKFSVSEWYQKRTQIFSAARFYAEKEANVLYSSLPGFLTEELQSFGFHSALVVLYDTPIEIDKPFEYFQLPDKAILMGFDYKAGYNARKLDYVVEFNPREKMVPDEFISYYNEGSIVTTLFHNSIQYGYLILGCGNYDIGVYDLITRSVSSQILSCHSYTKLIEEQYSLNDKYIKLDLIAHTDELTGLRNRRGFMELGVATLNFSESMGQTGLIVYCDMDGLKSINDTYGHEEGDAAIKAMGNILSSCFRSNDIVARLAGDEFAIVSPGLSEKIFDKIKDAINNACLEWSKSEKKPYTLSISSGCAMYPDKNKGFDMNFLLGKADSSLYMEKRKKKNIEN